MTIVRPESPGEIRHGRNCPTSTAEAPPMLPAIRAAPQPATVRAAAASTKSFAIVWLRIFPIFVLTFPTRVFLAE